MAVEVKQVPTELTFVRRIHDRRMHEFLQRIRRKVRDNTAIIQELVIDPVSGDPDTEIELLIATVPLTPAAHGNFTMLHGLGVTPLAVAIEMTSAGLIWFQSTKYDDENLYLVASEGGLTADAKVFY